MSGFSPVVNRQKGVFSILTTVAALVLIIFVGMVLDAGRVMVVRGELKNATDACALAASAELNGLSGSTLKAEQAGQQLLAQWHRRHFQNESFDISDVSVLFSNTLNGVYLGASLSNTSARVAQCSVSYPSMVSALMGLVGYGSLFSEAVSRAGQMPGGKVCVLPLALVLPTGVSTYSSSTVIPVKPDVRVADLNTAKTDTAYAQDILDWGTCQIPTTLNRTVGLRASAPSSTILTAIQSRYDNDPVLGTSAGTTARRLIALAAVTTGGIVKGWACLELTGKPLNASTSPFLYRGVANNGTFNPVSACIATGYPGNTAGPFVPVLLL